MTDNLSRALTWLKSVDWQDTGLSETKHIRVIIDALAKATASTK